MSPSEKRTFGIDEVAERLQAYGELGPSGLPDPNEEADESSLRGLVVEFVRYAAGKGGGIDAIERLPPPVQRKAEKAVSLIDDVVKALESNGPPLWPIPDLLVARNHLKRMTGDRRGTNADRFGFLVYWMDRFDLLSVIADHRSPPEMSEQGRALGVPGDHETRWEALADVCRYYDLPASDTWRMVGLPDTDVGAFSSSGASSTALADALRQRIRRVRSKAKTSRHQP